MRPRGTTAQSDTRRTGPSHRAFSRFVPPPAALRLEEFDEELGAKLGIVVFGTSPYPTAKRDLAQAARGSAAQPQAPRTVPRGRRTMTQSVPPADRKATRQPVGRRTTRTAHTRRFLRRHRIEHQPHQPTARFPRVAHPPWRSTLIHPASGRSRSLGNPKTPARPGRPQPSRRLIGPTPRRNGLGDRYQRALPLAVTVGDRMIVRRRASCTCGTAPIGV